jgi:hypothetical protein|tara:strand:- start:172 stop:501 length:330 start_codon:yes stop_codon:yes gene_type:complete
MNPVTDIVFSITWVLLLVWAIRTIVRGWRFASQDTIKPRGMWTTQVTRRIHPEMIDVEPGEELMGVTFDSPSCNLEEYKELQDRIAELRSELEGDDDEDDDDGDVVVRV